MLQTFIQKITSRENLTAEEMTQAMQAIMQGEATSAQIAGFLVGMRMKGETVTEIVAAAKVMQKMAVAIPNLDHPLIDIVGTGGDGSHTFNISTTSAFVVAAAGGRVAKHGNRSISSRSGSADVLEKAGVNLHLDPKQIAQCVTELGIGFMFAPHHHLAMKHTLPTRKELGIRTFFNLLGVLTNPAHTKHQLIGVYAKEWVIPLAEALQQLGSIHALVVHAEDGLDEISIAAPTFVAELKNNAITSYTITPEQFNLPRQSLASLKVENAEQSLELLQDILHNKKSPARDIVVLNAGAAIYIAGLTNTLADGIIKADATISSGLALKKLTDLINLTKQLGN